MFKTAVLLSFTYLWVNEVQSKKESNCTNVSDNLLSPSGYILSIFYKGCINIEDRIDLYAGSVEVVVVRNFYGRNFQEVMNEIEYLD